MDREAVVFLIDASPAMLRRAPGATTHAVDGARPDASSSTATGRGGAGSAVATYLDVALDCARGMLRDRVVAAPSDKQGVVFFNAERTRGLDDHLDGLSARERVYVHHRMAPPSARRIQDLGDFIGSDGVVRFQETVGVRDIDAETAASTGGNAMNTARAGAGGDGYYDALLRAHHVAREMLNDHPPAQRVAKRCLLFTNRDAPLPVSPVPVRVSNAHVSDDDSNAVFSNEDGRELVAQWREFADVHKIDVRLFALPRTTSENAFDENARDSETNAQRSLRIVPFDASKFYDHLLTCCGDASEAEAADFDAPNAEPSGAGGGRLISAGHALVAFDASSVPVTETENASDGLHGGFGLDMVQRAFRKQTRRARKVRGSFFRFGTEKEHAVAVALYAPFASAKRPKPVKVHCRDLSEVHCETVFVNTAVGAYVEKDALDKKFVHIGDARAVVTRDELADAKRAVEEDGIHLIGFRENTRAFRESFLRWARTGRPARLMRPAAVDDAGGKSGGKGAKYGGFRGGRGDTSGGDASAVRPLRSEAASKAAACDAFFALADAMRRKNRVGVGITARTGSRDAGARGCVMVPAEDADGQIIGMRVIDAPFADDIRYPERNHDFAAMAEATAAAADAIVDEPRGSAFDDVAGSRGATAEQVRAAEEVIDALAVHAYDPADIANPALARHYRVLECQALDVPWTDADERETDATRPPSTLELERVGVKEPAQAFKRSVYGENHEHEASEDLKPAPSKRPRPIGGGLSDDAPIDFASLARDDQLERCTAAALKAYCKENELKTTGVKAALAERVKAHALGG
jgi:ATP-dependent DNA helicase 2 subunit 1